ncbi:MAG: N-acetylmuramoyl-L-alanine amidase [Thermoanaerobaculia bacterium]
MVRRAVDENLDLIHGSRAARRSRRLSRLLITARLVFLVGLPAGLVATSMVLAEAAQGWLETSRAAVLRQGPAPGLAPSPWRVEPVVSAPFALDHSFPAPLPIDRKILPLMVRRVVLDPGHGGDSIGTEAPLGLVEKEVTLDIALRLRRMLEQASYEVVMTRDEDVDVSLAERAEYANREGGDIFVSIHVNWFDNLRSRGIETYYLGPTDDPYISDLAAMENRDSGIPLAEFRDILERVYADVRQEESQRLASAVQRALHRSLSSLNSAVEDRGVKTAPFGVLVRTEMPAILAEVSCLSNEAEARRLVQPLYREYIAEALYDGLLRYARGLNASHNKRS